MTDTTSKRPRNDAVDLLRGLVMVIMALDHVRDFFTDHPGDPTTMLGTTTPAMFLTRWVTHFCAPVFVFLAGAGVFLAGARGKSKPELARFLFSRGLWLVVVELTLVRAGWFFDVSYAFAVLQVIWAIGVSMIVLAALVFLPLRAVGAFGVALVVGHDLLDGVHAADLGSASWLWSLLHERGALHPFGRTLLVIYPLVPWVGVMAAGYAFGSLLMRPADERRRALLRLGAALTLAFVVVRAVNRYGDPLPWTSQRSSLFTAFSFLACTKYPPSLDYLLMTLGPAIAFLGWADGRLAAAGETPRWARPFVTFGRVPFFYYVLHVPLLHGLAVALGVAVWGSSAASPIAHKVMLPDAQAARYGFSLPVVYAAWIVVVLLLYPACRWFAGVKARHRSAWLSYL
ncbi:MAG TPA: heparan-alpha-glucosaminide N-acetyltransferase domain-containing protein [Polyangia bacterium]|nr:heparan-alpha-glucosaminide N-acetyltransferase domain-containing protein [Polyangia bacterium]